MTAVALHQVRPAGARGETLALVVATLLVGLGLTLWIRAHGTSGGRQQIYEWQVSAFETLAGPDQAIYNALDAAKYDILYLYDDLNMMNQPGETFRWPSIMELEEFLVPPFVRDGSWKQNGSLQWSLHEPLDKGEMQGSVMYLGTGGSAAGQGSFLLVIGHVHAGFSNNNSLLIWWNAEPQVAMPQSGFNDSLILQGWRQVVPYSGATEIRRLFGPQPEDAAAAESQDIADELFGGAQ
ncbi:MAG: hypothetical protein M3Y79_10950 [Pseudomonadota bacterium]|nr:hypothetical protein [Pseudomonadota bacterium]